MARNKNTSMTLFQFMNLLITLLAKNGQYRTMLHYKATLNSYKRFRDNKDIALKDIDAEEMRSYEAYLQNIAKVCNNTSSFYLRVLRATYNKAMAKGLVPQQNPFKNVYTGIAKTSKRAISTETVSQIKSMQSLQELTSMEEMAADESYGDAVLGGQNPLAMFCAGADKIDLSNMSIYDQGCNEEFQNAMKNYFEGNATYDEALDLFYKAVVEKYPELSY